MDKSEAPEQRSQSNYKVSALRSIDAWNGEVRYVSKDAEPDPLIAIITAITYGAHVALPQCPNNSVVLTLRLESIRICTS